MEENQTPESETTFAPAENRPDVGFPMSSPNSSNGSNKWIFLLLFLVLLLVGGGIFLFTRNSGNSEEASPEPTSEFSESTETPVPTPSATPSAVDKSKVKVEVQNGTGITGEAAYLQGQLRSLGYTSITVGNSKSQDNTVTTVTFKKDLSSAISDELTTKLQALYQDVTTQTSSTQTSDVLIVTGLRKGATPKPSASPTVTPKASSTPKPSGSASASPIATPIR